MMDARVRQITPDMAFELLAKNTNNYRKIVPATVAKYAEAMRRGEWELNGEAIVFAKNGTLLNGQHRLTAIVESGVTVPILVVTGVDNNVITYDDGRTRTSLDVAKAQGVEATTRELAIANVMTSSDFDGTKFHKNSKKVVAEYAGAHLPTIRQAVTCCGAGSSLIMRRSWAMTVAYLLLRNGEDPSTIADFSEVVNTGLPIAGRECSSALVFRNMMYMQPSLTRKADEPINMTYAMAAYSDFKIGLKRRNSYALKTFTVSLAEELWHKIRKEDKLE